MYKPFLTTRLNQSFPDPSQFTKEEEFTYAAKTTSVYKKVISELLSWIDGQVEAAKALRKKKENLTQDPFEIGQE